MTLDKEWEKFRGGPANRSSEQVRVTINRRGMIYLNTRAYEAFGRPKAVAIYFNREADAIALEPAYERFKENFQVVKKQMGWAVHASTFTRHHKIRVPDTQRFIRPDLTNEGQLILNLRETVTAGGMEREKKGRSERCAAERRVNLAVGETHGK
jgi:hypothetical protein